jgi:hypothetical protein
VDYFLPELASQTGHWENFIGFDNSLSVAVTSSTRKEEIALSAQPFIHILDRFFGKNGTEDLGQEFPQQKPVPSDGEGDAIRGVGRKESRSEISFG